MKYFFIFLLLFPLVAFSQKSSVFKLSAKRESNTKEDGMVEEKKKQAKKRRENRKEKEDNEVKKAKLRIRWEKIKLH